ncbi:MAG: DUF2130 domain-containing protein [Ferruginibacter sp.]|nr:DUF2130 domain-containing protein [Ferruginibacter sp.]
MTNNIKCPDCGHVFDVENVLAADIEKKLQHQYQQKLQESLYKIEENEKKLEADKLLFEEKKKNENDIFLKKIQQEKQKIEKEVQEQLTKSISSDFENRITLLQKDKNDNEEKLKEARKKELEFLQKEQQLQLKEAELEITLQKKLQTERHSLGEQIRKQEIEKNAIKENEQTMRMRELEKQLEDQKKLADEMKRKAEQGSMQLQGEVQEQALEEMLAATFPFDIISEVGKGVRGADCIQTVRNHIGQDCGKIIYESKRTEAFTAEWIEKLKKDMLAQAADIAVIVTKTMPKDLQQFGEKNGVYICTFAEASSLAKVLRNAILKISESRSSQENKGEKMVAMYNYLTSHEFVGNMNAMREGFRGLRSMMQKEREDFEKNFKKKEKQIELIIQNSLHISGSVEGIAGQDLINMQLVDGENEK